MPSYPDDSPALCDSQDLKLTQNDMETVPLQRSNNSCIASEDLAQLIQLTLFAPGPLAHMCHWRFGATVRQGGDASMIATGASSAVEPEGDLANTMTFRTENPRCISDAVSNNKCKLCANLVRV